MTDFSLLCRKSKAEPKFTEQARSSGKIGTEFMVKTLKQSRFINATRAITSRPQTIHIESCSGVMTWSSSSKSRTSLSTSNVYYPVGIRDADIFEPFPKESQYLHFDTVYPGLENQLRAELIDDTRLKLIGRDACEQGAWKLHLPCCSCARHLDEDCWGCDEFDYEIHYRSYTPSVLRDLRIIAYYFSECRTNATKALDWFLAGETDREGLKARVIPTLYEMTIMSYQWMMLLKEFSEPLAARSQASNFEDSSSNDDSFYSFNDSISYLDLNANDSSSDTSSSSFTSRAFMSSICTTTNSPCPKSTTTSSLFSNDSYYALPLPISHPYANSHHEPISQPLVRGFATSQHLSETLQRLDEDIASLKLRRISPFLGTGTPGLQPTYLLYKILSRLMIKRMITQLQVKLHVRLTRTQRPGWVERTKLRLIEAGGRDHITFLERQMSTSGMMREMID